MYIGFRGPITIISAPIISSIAPSIGFGFSGSTYNFSIYVFCFSAYSGISLSPTTILPIFHFSYQINICSCHRKYFSELYLKCLPPYLLPLQNFRCISLSAAKNRFPETLSFKFSFLKSMIQKFFHLWFCI